MNPKTHLGLLAGAALALGCGGVESAPPDIPVSSAVCSVQRAAHYRCTAEGLGGCESESSEVAACRLAEVDAATSDTARFDEASLFYWDGGEIYGATDQRERAREVVLRALPTVVAEIDQARRDRRYGSAISRIRFVEGIVRLALGTSVFVEKSAEWKSIPREDELFAEAVRFHVDRFDAAAHAGRPSSSARHACRAATFGRGLVAQDASVSSDTKADIERVRQACEEAITSPTRRRRDLVLDDAQSGLMPALAMSANAQATPASRAPRLRVFDVKVALSQTEPKKTVCVEHVLDAYMVLGGSGKSRVERPCLTWQTKGSVAFSLELTWPAGPTGATRRVVGGHHQSREFNHDLPLGTPNEEPQQIAAALASKMTAEELLATVQLDSAVFAAVDALGVSVALAWGDPAVLEEACSRLLEQDPADTSAAARLFPAREPTAPVCSQDADEIALYASPYIKNSLGFVGYPRQ